MQDIFEAYDYLKIELVFTIIILTLLLIKICDCGVWCLCLINYMYINVTFFLVELSWSTVFQQFHNSKRAYTNGRITSYWRFKEAHLKCLAQFYTCVNPQEFLLFYFRGRMVYNCSDLVIFDPSELWKYFQRKKGVLCLITYEYY